MIGLRFGRMVRTALATMVSDGADRKRVDKMLGFIISAIFVFFAGSTNSVGLEDRRFFVFLES